MTTTNPILSNKIFSSAIVLIAIVLSAINIVFKSNQHIGVLNVISILLFTLPLIWLVITKQTPNRHTKWFLIPLFILAGDICYYNNIWVQDFLPSILYVYIVMLYMTSMDRGAALYQTVLPIFERPFSIIEGTIEFFKTLFQKDAQSDVSSRVVMAIVITIPFVALFVVLFMQADENFSYFIKELFSFPRNYKNIDLLFLPVLFAVYVSFYAYSLKSEKVREPYSSDKKIDTLIVSIFLFILNTLFLLFIAFQLPFMFNSDQYISNNIVNIAEYARDGFFQLMWVMGIVVAIYLYIMRVYNNENIIALGLSILLVCTIIIGISSVNKMYLYQSLKGATVLRYYVVWFDYLLLFILSVGIVAIFRKKSFIVLLNVITVASLSAFTLISSINIDGMVAHHNISKFKTQKDGLDIYAIQLLSIDALPYLKDTNLTIRIERGRQCSQISHYNWNYCHTIKEEGTDNLVIHYQSWR